MERDEIKHIVEDNDSTYNIAGNVVNAIVGILSFLMVAGIIACLVCSAIYTSLRGLFTVLALLVVPAVFVITIVIIRTSSNFFFAMSSDIALIRNKMYSEELKSDIEHNSKTTDENAIVSE